MQNRFFIIGAPKCGTTSLARWLADHPQIYFSPIKEPHFYCTDLKFRNVCNKRAYDKLFAKAPSSAVMLGEASTWYLFSQEAIPNILRAHPNAKFIVMTRDPVEMAISLFFHNRNKLHEPESDFEKAWKLQEVRACDAKFTEKLKEPKFLQYRTACALGSLLERLYSIVDLSQVLHLRLEDMRENPLLQYQRVLYFLCVDDDHRIDFPVYNEAQIYRSAAFQRILQYSARFSRKIGIYKSFGLKKLVSRKLESKEINPEFRKYLENHFEPERRKLQYLFDQSVNNLS